MTASYSYPLKASKTTLSPAISPLFGSAVQAGFPSPADDYIEQYLDLNSYLVSHPAATFFVTALHTLLDAGIHAGDLLVIDRSLEAMPGKLVLAIVNEQLIVRRVVRLDKQMALQGNEQHLPPMPIDDESDNLVWGVITHIIHRTK